MFILFLLASLSQSKKEIVRSPATVLMWAIVILFILIISCIFSSVFFKWPLNLTKWIDPVKEQVYIPDIINVDTIPPKTNANPNKLLDTSQNIALKPTSLIKTKLIKLSIQLNSLSNGYKEILLNGKKINVLPESTTFNPRIELVNSLMSDELFIVTKSGDTCSIPIPKNENSNTFRIIPNCLN